MCVGVRVQTHTSSGAISRNSSSCCHRHFSPASPLLVPGKQRREACVQVDNGRNGSLRHSLSLSITHFLPFSIPLAIYPCLLSSCLPFPARIPHRLTSASIKFPHEMGQEVMTPPPLQPALWVSLNLAWQGYFPQGSCQCAVCVELRIVLCPILDLYFLSAADAAMQPLHCAVTAQRLRRLWSQFLHPWGLSV